MPKLKTLKGFGGFVDLDNPLPLTHDNLRQEAIKWIKKFQSQEQANDMSDYNCVGCCSVIGWIKHFFNISKEDWEG